MPTAGSTARCAWWAAATPTFRRAPFRTAWDRPRAIRWPRIEDLADQVVARGVKRVDGGIIGDDTWYVWQPYATGWGIDDPMSDDGPPISALTLNDNVLTLSVRPGASAGSPAALSLAPAVELLPHREPCAHGGCGGRAADPLPATAGQSRRAAVGHDAVARSRAGPADRGGRSGAVRGAGAAHGVGGARGHGGRRARWRSIASRTRPAT